MIKAEIVAHSLSPQGDELISVLCTFPNNKTTGDYIQSFKSATEAGRVLNIDRKAITNNCSGKSKSSGGFIWSKIKKENYYD